MISTELDALICAMNNRVSSINEAGSAAQRFYGREIRLGLPSLGLPLSDEKHARMQEAMQQYRTRHGKTFKTHNAVQYKIGQHVLVFTPKEGQFCDTGTVESWTPGNDGLGPQDYSIRMESRSLQRVNSSWLSSLPEQDNSQEIPQ